MSDAKMGLRITYKDAEFHLYSVTPRRYVVESDHYRRSVYIKLGRWARLRDRRTVFARLEAAKAELKAAEAERELHCRLEEG